MEQTKVAELDPVECAVVEMHGLGLITIRDRDSTE
jgi:hypothetical protein